MGDALRSASGADTDRPQPEPDDLPARCDPVVTGEIHLDISGRFAVMAFDCTAQMAATILPVPQHFTVRPSPENALPLHGDQEGSLTDTVPEVTTSSVIFSPF